MSYAALGQFAPQCADSNASSQGKAGCMCVSGYVCQGPIVTGWGCLAACVKQAQDAPPPWKPDVVKELCEKTGNLWDFETQACYPVAPDTPTPTPLPGAPPLSLPFPQGPLPPPPPGPPPPPIIESGPAQASVLRSPLVVAGLGALAGLVLVGVLLHAKGAG